MQPALALLIYFAFVLFLLTLERKQSPELSFVSWIPTIYMLLMASKPLGIWFRTGGDMESGTPVDRAFLTIILFSGLAILAKRQFSWSNILRNEIWLLFLVGYMLVSCFWSDFPYTSLKRSIREVVAVVMAFLILTEPDPRQALQSIFKRIIYVLIPFSHYLIHYNPSLGREYDRWSGLLMWIGVTTQKNGLGRLCLFSAFFLIWTFIRRWHGADVHATRYQTLLEVFILILTLWLRGGPQHGFSYSATTNVAFVLGLGTLTSLIWMKKRQTLVGPKTFFFIITFIMVYGTITPFVGKLSFLDISSMVGRNETLTGRNEVWATLLPYALQRPLWGYGFGGFWTDAMRAITSAHAHNGYLDVILNLGLFGLFLFSLFLLSFSRKAQRVMALDFDWGCLSICFLIMALVHNITESTIVGFTGGLSLIILFMAVSSIKIAEISNNS